MHAGCDKPHWITDEWVVHSLQEGGTLLKCAGPVRMPIPGLWAQRPQFSGSGVGPRILHFKISTIGNSDASSRRLKNSRGVMAVAYKHRNQLDTHHLLLYSQPELSWTVYSRKLFIYLFFQ